jgi:hypothetical protein
VIKFQYSELLHIADILSTVDKKLELENRRKEEGEAVEGEEGADERTAYWEEESEGMIGFD